MHSTILNDLLPTLFQQLIYIMFLVFFFLIHSKTHLLTYLSDSGVKQCVVSKVQLNKAAPKFILHAV